MEKIRELLSSDEKNTNKSEEALTEDHEGITCPVCEKEKLKPFMVVNPYGKIIKFDISTFLHEKEVIDTS